MDIKTDQVADGDTQQAHGNEEGLSKSEFEQVEKSIAYETHRKALTQRARFKEERDELNARLQEIQQKELEQKGEHSKVIESLRAQLSEKESKMKSMQQNYGWNIVGSQIKAELAARGVKNPDKALKFASSVHSEDLNTIEVDDSYNVNRDDLTRFVDGFLNENADMNFVSRPTVKDTPNLSGREDSPRTVNKQRVEKMSSDELINELWRLEGKK